MSTPSRRGSTSPPLSISVRPPCTHTPMARLWPISLETTKSRWCWYSSMPFTCRRCRLNGASRSAARLPTPCGHAAPAGERIGLYASGGLSHFTAGYPWAAYDGPRVHGSIDDEFDRRTLKCLATGNGYELSKLTSEDLLNSGNIELRSWICAVGAVGGNTPWASVYEPFPPRLMGMAVAWTNCEVTV